MRVVKILSLILVFATLFSSYGNATEGGGNTNKKTESSAKVDYTNFKCLKTLAGHSKSVKSVAYSPDGTKIISGLADSTIKIWDANTGQCLQTMKGDKYCVDAVAYSPDGKRIISGGWDNTVKIWDANTGQCLKTLKGHSDDVESVAYSPDGTKIISGSDDPTIKIWGEE